MKEIYEEIKKNFFSKRLVLIIVIILFLLGLLFGSIYITILDNDNKKDIIDSVSNYYSNIDSITFTDKIDIFKNNLFNNYLFYIVMWILGISVIGLPIIFCMLFFKSFILGFNIASIFACFKFKGFIYIILYLIPSNLLLLILTIFLSTFSSNLSINLATNAFKKKTFNFGLFMGKYLFILLVYILILTLVSLYNAFIEPSLLNLFTNII